jgi:hypothetical protein
MNYFLDTEFIELGHKEPLILLSLAIVSEDGREYYVENSEASVFKANDWVRENVLPHLTGPQKPREEMARDIINFVGGKDQPRFWGYFADYDWVLFCQLFGAMIDLPPTFPMYCWDLKQEMSRLEVGKPLIEGCGPPHHALSDARWNKAFWEYLKTKGLK